VDLLDGVVDVGPPQPLGGQEPAEALLLDRREVASVR
jgi:hypothetical protein